VYNAALEFAQFWDGREKDVEAQAKGPVTNPVEMAMPSEKRVIDTLRSMPGYVEAFAKAFPGEKDPVTFENLARAIGAFERKLLTPSRWDKLLKGDPAALTDAEKQGFNDFVAAGCGVCHNGPLLGGDKYMKLGSVKPWPDVKDLGRYAVTKVEADKLHFKVPMLRNIERTGPYGHDGKLPTLADAVTKMAVHQNGKTLTPEQVASIITFLKALTGELPAALVPKPALPPSGPKTPKPDPG
jgi:cytochrome c peroxidase